MEVTLSRTPENQALYAQRFALWIAIAAMVMMFAGFTSAYIVKKGDAETWVNFNLPDIFYLSTALIVLSSGSMHWAMVSFKRNQMKRYRTLIATTLLLGLGFIGSQVAGWQMLGAQGFNLTAEVSADFFYVISGAHAIHVFGGLVLLLAAWSGIHGKLKKGTADLMNNPTPEKRKFRVELTATYWHFVDALWIYLFIFLLYNHS